jgi:hypothetical protein
MNEQISRGGRVVAGFGIGAASGVKKTSYEDAIDATASHLQKVNVYGQAAGSDLTDEQLSEPMSNVWPSCAVPSFMKVTVKVAVKWGKAVGVTVTTHPHNATVASCVDRAVRALSWPSSPKLDSFTTQY